MTIELDVALTAAEWLPTVWAKYRKFRFEHFMQHLADKGLDGAKAEQRLKDLMTHQSGRRLIQQIFREVALGTETVSLAAMAILAGRGLSDITDRSVHRLQRLVDGLMDRDALVFLVTLDRAKEYCIDITDKEPYQTFSLNVAEATAALQTEDTLGIEEGEIFHLLAAMIERRLVLPDPGRGRLGGGPPTMIFGVGFGSHAAYALLWEAARLAETKWLQALKVRPADDVFNDAKDRLSDVPDRAAVKQTG